MSADALSAEGLRDRLAQIEEEHATLRSELAAFQSDYLRLVGVVFEHLGELAVHLLRARVGVRLLDRDDPSVPHDRAGRDEGRLDLELVDDCE